MATIRLTELPGIEIATDKADPRRIQDCGSKQTFALNAKKETTHPTEKPVALMDHYIRNSSNQGDVVLDPMMGSAATVVAALQAGRRAIGIEIDPDHYEMACARVAQAQSCGLAV